MNIVIISLNYAPEDSAIGLYSTQMAEYLVEIGWDVTVITGYPYYPKWEIAQDYKNKDKFFEENRNGVRVLRFKQFVPSSPTFLTRIIHLLDFTSGSLTNLKKISKADVVLSVIPFTTAAWLGKKLSKRLHAKHWIHMQDFEFDIAIQSGLTSKRGFRATLLKVLHKLESSLLNSADIASTISPAMVDKLALKTNSKTVLFPNWTDPLFIDPKKAGIHPYLKSDKFKILYSGNLGSKQDWNFFFKVVEQYKNEEEIEFIIVGDGAKKSLLEESISKYAHVKHFTTVPYGELNDLLCSADLHILFQKEEVLDTVLPSKILNMMASGKPSVITGNLQSEVATIFKKANAGKFYSSSDLNGVIQAITIFKNKAHMLNTNSENARAYVIENFAQNKIHSTFQKELQNLVNE